MRISFLEILNLIFWAGGEPMPLSTLHCTKLQGIYSLFPLLLWLPSQLSPPVEGY
ncbi:hypothetical protein LINGRAHAP2_LOCUS8185 [Linum grandiflorum]